MTTTKRAYGRVQAILKVVERCNLNCSYCYYFNGGDQSYSSRPPIMARKVFEGIAEFLGRGAQDVGLESVWIALHGGEPLMMKPALIDEMCSTFYDAIGSKTSLTISVQTNGTHLNEKIENIIRKHRLAVSVSIDGVGSDHDRERKDHFGRGSYEIVMRNYKRFRKIAEEEGLPPVEIISVLDARIDYKSTISTLHEELGVNFFNFLLPDCNHDDGIPNGRTASEYGQVLCDIFDAWQGNEEIYVREIDRMIERFQLAVRKEKKAADNMGEEVPFVKNQILTIRSDGDVEIDDTFMPASGWRNSLPKVRVDSMTLAEYLNLPVFDEIDAIYKSPPAQCRPCVWRNICNGGDLENRFSNSRGFDNPSIYCSGLKIFYWKIARFLRKNGYPEAILRDRLTPGSGGSSFDYAK